MEEVDFFDSKIVKYLKIIERERKVSVCVSGREKKEGRKREIKNFILLKNLQNRTKKKFKNVL